MPNPPNTVLLVDDEKAILQVMKAQLEIEGYAVLTEQTGEDAVEKVKTTKLLAVLLDLNLKEISGLEVLKQIVSIAPLLPVIMVTGSHDEAEAHKALELGAWEYITKPIDFQYLKSILLTQSQQ